MSISKLLEDRFKDWADVRVNDLTVDGTLTLNNQLFSGYQELNLPGDIRGSFLINPISIEVKLTKIGRVYFMAIQPFNITTGDQNNLGGDLYFEIPNIPVSMRPIETSRFPYTVQGVAGDNALSNIEYDFPTSRFYIEDAVNSPVFGAGGSNNMSFNEQTLTWIV